MSITESGVITLAYGRSGSYSCEITPERVALAHAAPDARTAVANDVRRALDAPLDFPPLGQAIIPDDQIVLALDRHTPAAEQIVAEIWKVLERRGVSPENVLILQPASLNAGEVSDPRSALQRDAASAMRWKLHDPARSESCAYLATTGHGQRIYVAREAHEADVVISIGFAAFDPVLGYRGTSSVLYPGLSSTDAMVRAQGQGHHELRPEDQRPTRQLIDEVAWLMGTQFSVQVIPAAGGGVAAVIAGLCESVYAESKRQLDRLWRVTAAERCDLVVVAVEHDEAGHGWEQLAAALSAARNLVSRGGKIVALTELAAPLGAGLELIRRCQEPLEAIKPLRQDSPPDLIAATQLTDAVNWARVFLLSQLESDVVEDLFIMPLESEAEVTRLLSGPESCAFLSSAQHVYASVRSS